MFNYIQSRTERHISSKNYYILAFTLVSLITLKYYLLLNRSYGSTSNIYDLILGVINEYFLIMYIYSTLFLFLIHNIVSNSYYDYYVLSRFKNKKQWYIDGVKTILFNSFLLCFILIISTIFIGFSLNIDNNWSPYANFLVANKLHTFGSIGFRLDILNSFTPLAAIIYNLIFLYFYLCFIGLIYFLGAIINFKIKAIPFILAYIPIVICLMTDKLFTNKTNKISLACNVMISHHTNKPETINPTILTSFIYWGFLTIGIFALGIILVEKKDLCFGEKL